MDSSSVPSRQFCPNYLETLLVYILYKLSDLFMDYIKTHWSDIHITQGHVMLTSVLLKVVSHATNAALESWF